MRNADYVPIGDETYLQLFIAQKNVMGTSGINKVIQKLGKSKIIITGGDEYKKIKKSELNRTIKQ